MSTQANINFERVRQAIEFIRANFKQQPTLDEVAAHVKLSPAHFQRLFREWAGTSPKKLLQYVSLQYAKYLLREREAGLLDTALETGLSGTSRLHDLFVNIEGMTPAEFRDGAAALTINYSVTASPFGTTLVASTARGVCHLAFMDESDSATGMLQERFPGASFVNTSDKFQQDALLIFSLDWQEPRTIKLHLKATPFQLKVWETLLTIPFGKLKTYGAIAHAINKPTAARAVGTAIGDNPVGFIIPCHRVIQTSGMLSGYRWGTERKSTILAWEALRSNAAAQNAEAEKVND